jgi:hypothetical protein
LDDFSNLRRVSPGPLSLIYFLNKNRKQFFYALARCVFQCSMFQSSMFKFRDCIQSYSRERTNQLVLREVRERTCSIHLHLLACGRYYYRHYYFVIVDTDREKVGEIDTETPGISRYVVRYAVIHSRCSLLGDCSSLL